jgi:hypothetical protein
MFASDRIGRKGILHVLNIRLLHSGGRMTFDVATREAARVADSAVRRTMQRYREGLVKHEDDLTGWLVGALDDALDGEIGGLTWDSAILTHRRSGEEGRYGADLLIHVSMNTPTQTYSKGVLVQAKRVEPDEYMTQREFDELIKQCGKMLQITAASFVFDYSTIGLRCGAATRIGGSSRLDLYGICTPAEQIDIVSQVAAAGYKWWQT